MEVEPVTLGVGNENVIIWQIRFDGVPVLSRGLDLMAL